MKLTKEMRNDFADRVINKIPVKSKWNREKITEELKKRLLKAQPKEVQEFSKKYPAQTNWTTTIFSWLNHTADGFIRYGRVGCINGSKEKDIDCEDLKAALAEFTQEMEMRAQMRERIYEQACCCSTLAQLEVVFPDLKGLMPKPVINIKGLPVAATGLTKDLATIGLEIPQ